MRISTIHSFCTSLLRSQAVEAGLDPRFAVLDTALSDTLLRHVVRDTFHRLIETEDDDAIQFVVQFGLERAKELHAKAGRSSDSASTLLAVCRKDTRAIGG